MSRDERPGYTKTLRMKGRYKLFIPCFISSLFASSVPVLSSTERLSSEGNNSLAGPRHEARIKPAEKKPDSASTRLSKTVSPYEYEITVEPDLQKFTFRGSESIKIKLLAPCKQIVLNAIDLKISSAELEDLKENSRRLSAVMENDSKNEQLHLSFNRELKAGDYKLHLEFSGELNDKLRGFYRSYFKDKDGEKHWLCSTQFEPADARRMYPCFDEPEFKASFQINAIIAPELTAISNAPVSRVLQKDGKKIVSFDTTARMSTYLMALVIGEFNCTEERKSTGVPVRVWAPAGQEKMGNYPLDAACEILDYLTGYFGIEYPSKKLDLIAIPDFGPGAMENLGAITFKDSILLIDEKTATNFARRRAFGIIAHEIAHQWFGDLVTNRWWDDLWLNEAFATWAATRTESDLRPEWRTRTKAVLHRNDALSVDQLASTRAIHAHVGNPREASEMFDTITYEKGAAVLRMLEVFVGESVFRKGVHDYLEAHKFGNAASEDLWQAIATASENKPVSEMMHSWIFQAGFPIISASPGSRNSLLKLSQERFFLTAGRSDASQWIVPSMLRCLSCGRENNQASLLMQSKQALQSLPEGWKDFVINPGANGFYRVFYSTLLRKQILDNFQLLSPEEKLSFISDLSNLSQKGLLPVEDSLAVLLKLNGEKDSVVLCGLVSRFDELHNYMDTATTPFYEKFLRMNLVPLARKIGWEPVKGEEETVKDLRADILKTLGSYGQDSETIKESFSLFNRYLNRRDSVNADLLPSVLSIVAYNGSENEYEKIRAALKNASNSQEEKRLLSALTGFRKPELIGKTLDMILLPETRATDALSLLCNLLSERESKKQAWNYLKSNWAQLQRKFPPRFNKNILSACRSFDSRPQEKELCEFFSAHPPEMAQAAMARTVEELQIKVLFRQRNESRIQSWVRKQSEKSPG